MAVDKDAQAILAGGGDSRGRRAAGAASIVVPLAANHSPAPVHAAVPPVLDGIVAAAVETPCDLSPTLAHLRHQPLDHCALLWCDGVVVEGGLEVLVEAFTALLWCAGADEG